MKGPNIDKVRKDVYKVLASFRGKDITGGEVSMGVWEATRLDFLRNLLKLGFRIVTPFGIELDIESLELSVNNMETLVPKEDKKPDCFGTKKVRFKKGVSRYDCVLCSWEVSCVEKYKKRKAKKKKRKKK